MISIDYETYLISDGHVFPKPVCLSYYDGKNTGLLNKKESEEYLSGALNSGLGSLEAPKLIIAHNAVFECGVTVTHYPDLAELVFEALDNGLIYCTKINEELWNIQREKKLYKLALADLVQHYFNKDISATKGEDAWRMRYSELDGIPIEDWPKEAVDYAIDDSIWAHKVQQKQRSISQKLALKSAVYLNLMGAQGFNIDKNRVDLLESEIWDFLTPRYDFLVSEGFCEFEGKTPRKKIKKLKDYIETLDLELMHTNKGATATSSEALQSYMAQVDNPIIKTFSELTKYEKILTAFIKNLKNNDRIYTQYSTTKNTGRTSSSGSKLFPSVNIQQMPREVKDVTYDIRNCFVPRKGFKLVSIDYSGLELCSAAHQLYTTLGYSKMRTALNEGDRPTDMHSKLAAKINNMSYEEFMARKSELKSVRQKAKPINLGFPGGIGYDTMKHLMWRDGIETKFKILEKSPHKKDLWSLLLGLSANDVRIKRLNKKEYALVQDELVLLKRYIFDLYPELESFLKETHKKYLTGESKWKKNEYGEWEEEPMYRYECYGFIRDWCTYTALCNGYLMQTPSAIGAQTAMGNIIRRYWNNDEVFPQAFIHDEIVAEISEHDLERHVRDISEMMIDGMHTILSSVRMTVEAEVCGDCWRKSGGEWSIEYWKDPDSNILRRG